MRGVFADTSFWVALFDLRDPWHGAAVAASQAIAGRRIVTTHAVLSEFLNFFCANHAAIREGAAHLVDSLLDDPQVRVVATDAGSFRAGLSLYRRRPDKSYSLTDCLSMLAMHASELSEVLTTDKHFAQEGYRIVLTR